MEKHYGLLSPPLIFFIAMHSIHHNHQSSIKTIQHLLNTIFAGDDQPYLHAIHYD